MPKIIEQKNPGRDDDWILSGDLDEADFEELGRKTETSGLEFEKVTRFPSRPFRHLATMRALKHLVFESCAIKPDDFEDMAALPKLESLFFQNCPVTDDGVARLQNHPRLWRLDADGSRITDKAIPAIATIPKLTWLGLDGSKITDAGLEQLVVLKGLKDLSLRNTAVTNAGILQLAALPKLNLVMGVVEGSAVDEQGLDAFFAARKASRKSGSKGKAAEATAPFQHASGESRPDELDAARETLYAFFKAMNAWQLEYTARAEAARRQGDNALPESLFDECREDCRRIFETYCTRKKRAYGRPETVGIGGPTSYEADPALEPTTNAEALDRHRLVIETKQRGRLEQRNRYVLVKNGARWLLDSKQYWDGGWEKDIL